MILTPVHRIQMVLSLVFRAAWEANDFDSHFYHWNRVVSRLMRKLAFNRSIEDFAKELPGSRKALSDFEKRPPIDSQECSWTLWSC